MDWVLIIEDNSHTTILRWSGGALTFFSYECFVPKSLNREFLILKKLVNINNLGSLWKKLKKSFSLNFIVSVLEPWYSKSYIELVILCNFHQSLSEQLFYIV